MDASEREKVAGFYKKFSNPIVITDYEFNVVFCNRKSFIKNDTNLNEYSHASFEIPTDKQSLNLVIINGVSYCARTTPLSDDLLEFELFDSVSIRDLLPFTDALDKILPLIDGLNTNTIQMINTVTRLLGTEGCSVNEQYSSALLSIYNCSNNLRSINENLRIYTKMAFGHATTARIEVHSLVEEIVRRCNDMLSKCG